MIQTISGHYDSIGLSNLPHSRLYHLEPIGLGTEYVESLTSYIYRLANEHCIHINILLAKELMPLLSDGGLYQHREKNRFNVGTSLWKDISHSLNSANDTSNAWLSALEKLTLRCDLKYLTMCPWINIISSRGLIRSYQAWCPLCYQQWLTNRHAIYNPLLWGLEVINACDKHKAMLQLNCPHIDCQKRILALTYKSNSTVGFCPHCNRWLGSDNAIPVAENTWKDQEWIIKSVGELISCSPYLNIISTLEPFSLAFKLFLGRRFGGNSTAFAKELKMSRDSVAKYRMGTQHPQIATILKISALMGLSPLELLTGERTSLTERVSKIIELKTHRQRPSRKFDNDKVLNALRYIIDNEEPPPPSMAMVSKRLGYDHSYLIKRFPAECRTISDRYQQFRSEQAANRQKELSRQVRDIAKSLHEQGIYPSVSQMQKNLAGGMLLEKSMRTVLRATLKELGYTKD